MGLGTSSAAAPQPVMLQTSPATSSLEGRQAKPRWLRWSPGSVLVPGAGRSSALRGGSKRFLEHLLLKRDIFLGKKEWETSKAY